jgi:hypothetical protein
MNERELRSCDHCGAAFHPVREAQRFCRTACHDDFYVFEKRQALAAWRAQQRSGSLFLRSTLVKVESDNENNQLRRTG